MAERTCRRCGHGEHRHRANAVTNVYAVGDAVPCWYPIDEQDAQWCGCRALIEAESPPPPEPVAIGDLPGVAATLARMRAEGRT